MKKSQLKNFLPFITEQLPDMLWAKDTDGKYIYANDAICENLLMCTTEEIIGKDDIFFALRERARSSDDSQWHTFGELCHNSDDIVLQEMKPMLFEEFGNIRGELVYLEVHKAPFFDKEGKLLGVIGSGRDITKQKMLEKELRDEKEKFESFFKNSKDGIAILDMQSNFLDFNDAYAKMLGFEREELLSRSCMGLTADEDIEKSLAAIEEVLIKGFFKNLEKRCIRKDGVKVDVSISISLMPDKERVLINTKDISELKRKDQLIFQQSSLVQMGEMINMIAHQWRQPLNTISAAAINLSIVNEFEGATKELVEEKSEFIQQEIQKMSEIINDFMNFNKPSSNEEFKLYDSIININKIVEAQFKTRLIEVKVDIDKELKVFHNKKAIEHALLNLILNSRDAFEEQTVENKQILIDCKKESDKIVLAIQDNAGGIPQNIINKIFYPYFTTKEQGKGTGIGLYMTKQMVESIKGSTVSVESKDDKTLFKITFQN